MNGHLRCMTSEIKFTASMSEFCTPMSAKIDSTEAFQDSGPSAAEFLAMVFVLGKQIKQF